LVMLALEGKLVRGTVPAIAAQLDVEWRRGEGISLDLSGVDEVDSAGAALLLNLHRRAKREGRPLQIVGLHPTVAAALDLFPMVDESPVLPVPPGFLERTGEAAAGWRSAAFEYLLLCADVVWFGVTGLFKRRGIRWSIVAFEMASMGSRALGVVGLIAFLVGGTIALQSAVQLRQFGANIFVVDLIGVSLTRELGPLMAAIVVAGRSGSAVAAELATMTITEEVDALRTMGLHPTRFLVLPKVVAITITQPLLTVFADLLGIFGGFLVAVTYLEIGPATFFNRLQEVLQLRDVLIGLFKSVVFAQLIVTISAVYGLRTRGGADAVGRSTTAAVVASIFAVVVADSVASMVFYLGD
ncbi:MAG: MlaE family lipid ABC transporter permease subunit, partial [Myxococcota bacterium]